MKLSGFQAEKETNIPDGRIKINIMEIETDKNLLFYNVDVLY